MSRVRDYFKSQLLPPLKSYPTVIQNTLVEIIIQRLEELYEYTLAFPQIISPSSNRLEVLQAITQQFLFDIKDEAKLQEQLDILEHILYVFRRRGSLDTIENMWKYYGGDLPKEVQVYIPSNDLFRYSISSWSGKHVFQDEGKHRTGTYEIRLINNTYDITKLKEFMLKELVAAGNLIYFTNICHIDINPEDLSTNPFVYKVYKYTWYYIKMYVEAFEIRGFTWSNLNSPFPDESNPRTASQWSGRYISQIVLTYLLNIPSASFLYDPDEFFITYFPSSAIVKIPMWVTTYTLHNVKSIAYCTPSTDYTQLIRYLYDSDGNLITSNYPGYFIVGDTLLGRDVV